MNISEAFPILRYATPESLAADLASDRIAVHPVVAGDLRGVIGGYVDFLVAHSIAGSPRGQIGVNWKAPVGDGTRVALGLAPREVVPNIAFMEVPPAHWRRGIGQALLGIVLAEAADRGHKKVFLTVEVGNTVAKRLYDRMGFVDIGYRHSSPQFERSPDGTYGEPVMRDMDLWVRTTRLPAGTLKSKPSIRR